MTARNLPQKLVCVRCGRKAKLILHGTSYCTPCSFVGANSTSVPLLDTSPIVRSGNLQRGVRKALTTK